MRRVGILAGAGALIAAILIASASGFSSKTPSFKLRLPAPHHGVIYHFRVSAKLPSGGKVTGNPFLVNATNRASLPSWIRSAAAVVPKGPGKWDLFVAINAPKGLVGARRLSGGSASTENISVQTTLPPSWTVKVDKDVIEGCDKFKGEERDALYMIIVAASNGEGPAIFKFTEAADTHCRG